VEIDAPPRRALGWLLRYLAILTIGFLLLGSADTGLLCKGLARAADGALALLGLDASRQGSSLRTAGFSMQVAAACDGTDVCLLLGAAVLATAVPWRRRAAGLALALVLTQLVNVGRLAALFAVGVSFPQHFEIAHQILWQVAMTGWAVLFYVRWL
jgi:exosortase/archaeosortase family protein